MEKAGEPWEMPMMVPVKQFQIFNHDLIFHVKINKHTLLISMQIFFHL